MNHTCLCLPAKAGPHLLTLEGWKTELAVTVDVVVYRMSSVGDAAWWWTILRSVAVQSVRLLHGLADKVTVCLQP